MTSLIQLSVTLIYSYLSKPFQPYPYPPHHQPNATYRHAIYPWSTLLIPPQGMPKNIVIWLPDLEDFLIVMLCWVVKIPQKVQYWPFPILPEHTQSFFVCLYQLLTDTFAFLLCLYVVVLLTIQSNDGQAGHCRTVNSTNTLLLPSNPDPCWLLSLSLQKQHLWQKKVEVCLVKENKYCHPQIPS